MGLRVTFGTRSRCVVLDAKSRRALRAKRSQVDMKKSRAAAESRASREVDQRPTTTSSGASGAMRETIESIAMAIVLAFLFRAFVAEAFVIPTGSMAPTLMGQHKDVQCPQCGYWYEAGASIENTEDARGRRVYDSRQRSLRTWWWPRRVPYADIGKCSIEGRSQSANVFRRPDIWSASSSTISHLRSVGM